MGSPEKIMAVVNGCTLQHPFFDYLAEAEKYDIMKRIHNGNSSMVLFVDENNSELFAAVFDVEIDALHVREVGGKFPAHYKRLFVFAYAVAQQFRAAYVTVNTKIKGVERMIKNLGFQRDQNNQYFMAVE